MAVFTFSIVLSLAFFVLSMVDLKKKKILSGLILIFSVLSHPDVSFFLTASSDAETISMAASVVALFCGVFVFSKEYSIYYKLLTRLLFFSLLFSALISTAINLSFYLGYYGDDVIGILPMIYYVALFGVAILTFFKNQAKNSPDNSDLFE